ncbi:MAG TPA: RNA methyltransferase [Exilispira sp.]|nr:RNA methyltransferase [Exilispira sp.]
MEKDKIRFFVFLVGNEFAGNAGQIARTLGNFELDRLVLIAPEWQDPLQGLVFAHTPAGLNIFDNREIFPDLETAFKTLNIHLSIAFTRRAGKNRQINWNFKDYFNSFFQEVLKNDKLETLNVALVFGREKSGLNTDEIKLCSALAYIPTNPESPSLNLAQAVAIVLDYIYYELKVKNSPEIPKKLKIQTHPISTMEERENFYKDIISAAKTRQLFIKNDEISFRRLFERIFSSPIISSKDLSLLKSMLMRFIYAKNIEEEIPGQNKENKDVSEKP